MNSRKITKPKIGRKAPDFKLPATADQVVSLSDFKGSIVVLYFYPRDNTPGCTTESAEFASLSAKFKRANAIVFGVSQDSIRKHENFKKKLKLPFELLSDEDGVVCKKYGVLKLKKMYGKEFMGIERSTFIIDDKGVLRAEWRKVKVAGHVEEVVKMINGLNVLE